MKQTVLILLFGFLSSMLFSQVLKVENKMDSVQKYLHDKYGESMPEWNLSDLNGKEHSSKELKGKIILFNFWGVGCGACVKVHDDLVDLQESFKDKGLIIVNIESDERNHVAGVKKFVDKYNMHKNTLIKGKEFGLQMGAAGAFPTLVLVDRDGKIVYGHIGWFYGETKDKMIDQIKKL